MDATVLPLPLTITGALIESGAQTVTLVERATTCGPPDQLLELFTAHLRVLATMLLLPSSKLLLTVKVLPNAEVKHPNQANRNPSQIFFIFSPFWQKMMSAIYFVLYQIN